MPRHPAHDVPGAKIIDHCLVLADTNKVTEPTQPSSDLSPTETDAAAHAHTWDPITDDCTHAGCTRRKPQWLTDTENDPTTLATASTNSGGGLRGAWRRQPTLVRWGLGGLITSVLLSPFAPSLSNSIADSFTPGDGDVPVFQHVTPRVDETTPSVTVDPSGLEDLEDLKDLDGLVDSLP